MSSSHLRRIRIISIITIVVVVIIITITVIVVSSNNCNNRFGIIIISSRIISPNIEAVRRVVVTVVTALTVTGTLFIMAYTLRALPFLFLEALEHCFKPSRSLTYHV